MQNTGDGNESRRLTTADPQAIPTSGAAEAADPVEQALATALAEAAKSARWDVVTILARELEARRVARATASNVVPIAPRKNSEGR